MDQHFRNYKYRFELNTPAESWTDGFDLVWFWLRAGGVFVCGAGSDVEAT